MDLPPREHSQARLQSASHLSTSPNLNLTVTFLCRNKSSRETKFHPERELAHGTILSRPSFRWVALGGPFFSRRHSRLNSFRTTREGKSEVGLLNPIPSPLRSFA